MKSLSNQKTSIMNKIETKLLNSKFFNDRLPTLLLGVVFFIMIIAIMGFIKELFF